MSITPSQRRAAPVRTILAVALSALSLSAFGADLAKYADPAKPALPDPHMQLDLPRTARVVIDPQIDFMSPKGAAWGAVGESVTEQNLVPNLIKLFKASKAAGITVAISPHYYYPHDHRWKFGGPAELFQHSIHIFDRKDPLSLEHFTGSGADFMPEFKPYIQDGKTIVASPHKLYGPVIGPVFDSKN